MAGEKARLGDDSGTDSGDKSPDDVNDDFALFRRAMADVNRHDHRQERHLPEETAPKPGIKIRKPDLPAPTPAAGVVIDATDQGEAVLFARGGLQKKVIRKLKRGEYGFTEVLDLHGNTTAEAKPMLSDFLSEAVHRRQSSVLIIHGKGLRSGESGGVLKPFTLNWLKQQAAVKAFCSALPKDGGTGAVYVLLRAGRG